MRLDRSPKRTANWLSMFSVAGKQNLSTQAHVNDSKMRRSRIYLQIVRSRFALDGLSGPHDDTRYKILEDPLGVVVPSFSQRRGDIPGAEVWP